MQMVVKCIHRTTDGDRGRGERSCCNFNKPTIVKYDSGHPSVCVYVALMQRLHKREKKECSSCQ